MDTKLFRASMASLRKKVKAATDALTRLVYEEMMTQLRFERDNDFLYEKLQYVRWPHIDRHQTGD